MLASSLFACKNPSVADKSAAAPERPAYALVIHGGAGTLGRAEMTPEKEARYKSALDSALTVGEAVLRSGGSSLDAVEQTVAWLEDCPLFNAGRGAVFTHEGRNELDASVMDGQTQKAGAVGGVTTVKNPIRLARAVMEKSPHVFLTGRGAEQFASENGLETAPPSWFFTQERWEGLQKILAEEKAKDTKTGLHQPGNRESETANPKSKFGTVGCVALDKNGHLAAGTSTGGMTNKRWNRLGDTPVIGAGTYADDAVCGISCTGHGEFFIRYAAAHDVWARMSYKNLPLAEAAEQVIQHLLQKGGEGGLIALDRMGNVAMPFNCEGMYRGYAKAGGERKVLIFKE